MSLDFLLLLVASLAMIAFCIYMMWREQDAPSDFFGIEDD